jgi:hypothetical protein
VYCGIEYGNLIIYYDYVYTLYTYPTISMVCKMRKDMSQISQITPAQG